MKRGLLNSRFLSLALIIGAFLAVAGIARAMTPNPGHPWAEVGDGTFQVSGPTTLRTYAFPDADATVLTATSTGNSTQYYRGDGTFQTLNTDAVAEATNLYYTAARFNAAFAGKTTTDLAEGSNLYYTTTRHNTDFDTRLATKTTANLTEGSNLYYTQGRFDSAFGAKSTTNLAEGSNLYFTTARARGAISGTAPVAYDSSTGIISMPAASSSVGGYLTSADWSTFNDKISGTRLINTTAPLSGGGDLSTDLTLSITQASGSTDGYLSSSDWTSFNSKENGLTFSGPLSRSVNTISIPAADTSTDGYLTSGDWDTFNSKEDAIAVGTSTQYFTGDKTWAELTTDAVVEGANLYFTDTRADARIAAARGAANGIASLGADSKIPTSQLPALAITNTYVVADEPAMLALDAETGDVAVRTDENQSYILAGSDPSVALDWQLLLTPTDTVQSVNGQTGSVSLTTDDIPEGTALYYTDDLARAAISGTAPIDYDNTTGIISMAAADTTTDGYLSSTDWNIFNDKENGLTFSGPLARVGDTISLPAASGSTDGYLSSTDWTTFNAKLTSVLTSGHIFVGSGLNVATDVALSGDATLTNTGALTIANNAVTLAKMDDIPSGTIIGRNTVGTGDPLTLTTLPNAVQNNITRTGTITSGVWNGTSIDTTYTDAKIKTVTGTTNRLSIGGTATDPTFDIDAAYAGQASITTLGTISTGTWNGSVIDLAHGGTNANLTASNGGIFYSTGTAGAILAGTATAGQILQSGASAAPSWSTATYPATTGANQLLYSSATNTVGGLATGNDGVLVTNGSGIPSISSTIPSATQDNITRTGTITSGVWNGTAIADANIATPYIKADGTRTLSADWDAGAHAVTAQDFVVSGTGGAGYLNLVSQSSNAAAPSATGLNLFSGTAGNLAYTTKNGTDTFTRSFTGTLTANRSWALPDVGGTFMLKDGGQTVTAATWNGTVIGSTYGGTGVNNGSSTITLGGNFVTSGAFSTTLISTATTSVTLPTTGTLATLSGTETFTNKTLTSPTLSAGTSSAGTAPLKFTAGTNLASAESGAFEFDGKAFYSTTASGRGIAPSVMYSTNNGATNLSASTGVQPAFDTTGDVWNLQANTTYEFEGLYSIVKSGTTCTVGMAFGLGGGASVSSIKYFAIAHNAAPNTTTTAQNTTEITQVASTVINATSSTRVIVQFKGLIRMNAGGTVTPQIDFSASPTGPQMGGNSYIKFTPIGTDTVETVGNVG